MEEIDINELLADFELPELPPVVFVATYDPLTGEILSVGPSEAFADEPHKIEMDTETAVDIIEGRMQIGLCYVDLESEEFSIVETKNVFKIDDVLHRIPLDEWAGIEKPDIFITYDSEVKTLHIQLTEEYFGTLKIKAGLKQLIQRKTKWAGDTELLFIVTGYNDPHCIHEIFRITIDDLVGNTMVFNNVVIPKKFSIYTRRIFKNYIMDVK